MKIGHAQGFLKIAIPRFNLPGNGKAGTKDDGKIRPHFFQMEGFIEILCQKQVIETEIDAKGNHKNGDDPLLKGRILSAAAVEDPEAPRSRCAKSNAQVMEPVHPRKSQDGNHEKGHTKIDTVKDDGRVLYTGHEL